MTHDDFTALPREQKDRLLWELVSDAGITTAPNIERRVYRDSDEYREYLQARFQQAGGERNSFAWQGHRWAYRYTSFDDQGDYDLIWRPAAREQREVAA